MPQSSKFDFHGSGIGYVGQWILTVILCVGTFGLFTPWAFVMGQKWLCQNTTIDGRQLTFKGTGAGFFGQYLLILFFRVITFGLYIPWGFCRIMRWKTRNTYFAGVGDNEQSGAAGEQWASPSLSPPSLVNRS